MRAKKMTTFAILSKTRILPRIIFQFGKKASSAKIEATFFRKAQARNKFFEMFFFLKIH